MRQGLRLMTLFALALGTQSAAADASRGVLSHIEVRGSGARAEVRLDGNLKVPTYAVRTKNGGSVIVLEVAGVALKNDGVKLESTDLVTAATAVSSPSGVRIELALRTPASYRARVVDGDIVLTLEDLGASAPAGTAASAKGPAQTSLDESLERAAELTRIGLERRDGRERVIVELSRPAEFRVVPGSSGPARLEIKRANLGAAGRRPVDTSGLTLVQGVALKQEGDRVLVDVERLADSSTTAIREGNRIVWLFAPPLVTERGKPKPRTLVAAEPVEVDSDQVASFISGTAAQAKSGAPPSKYTGRRIDLDFKDADIHNILRLLAEVGGVNIVTSDDVTGSVTIRMRDVPWDQALDVIMEAKGLGAERRGNLIRVAPQAVLEKERELAIARRNQQVQLAPLETRLVPVSYATASDVQPRVQEVISPRGSVSVDERTNVLIVRDIVDNLDDVEQLVRTLDTQTPQVLVEARFVEATSSYTRDVGIQWGGDVSFNQAFGNQTGLVFPSNIGIAGGAYDSQTPTQGLSPLAAATAVPNFAINMPAAVGTGAGGALGLTFGSVDGNYNLNVRLSAAEQTGSLKIISSPRVLTLDNHPARISQGTQIPYSQISAQGVQTAFQTALLQLQVTPHVTADGSVSLKVNVTRNEPDFGRTGANGQPTILKREADTNLLVQDGHTAVIGGIYTRNTSRTVDQVPFFGDIPILGLLFQRRRTLDQRSELLIFLTPRIVNREQALMSSK
jgi:type IV pilus assembly protein PilQ